MVCKNGGIYPRHDVDTDILNGTQKRRNLSDVDTETTDMRTDPYTHVRKRGIETMVHVIE